MIILNIISSEAPQILQILDSTPLALWRGVGGEAFIFHFLGRLQLEMKFKI